MEPTKVETKTKLGGRILSPLLEILGFPYGVSIWGFKEFLSPLLKVASVLFPLKKKFCRHFCGSNSLDRFLYAKSFFNFLLNFWSQDAPPVVSEWDWEELEVRQLKVHSFKVFRVE